MIELSETDLARAVAPILEALPENLEFSRCATGRFNDTWFIGGADRPLVLRVAPPDDRSRMLFYEHRMMRQESEVHAIIRNQTSVPAPEILAMKEADPILGRDFVLMERLPGQPVSEIGGLTPQKVDGLFANVGSCLGQVHAITRDRYGYLGAHRPMEPQTCWADAFTVMWHKLIDDISACEGYEGDEADRMRRLLDHRIGLFDRDLPASLLHMDVWAENILCDKAGNLTGIIDWDRSLWGDPEIDFAVLDYCGISTPSFWEGYGQRRDTGRDAQIRRVFYLLYEIQKYIVIQRVRRYNPVAADGYRARALELAQTIEG